MQGTATLDGIAVCVFAGQGSFRPLCRSHAGIFAALAPSTRPHALSAEASRCLQVWGRCIEACGRACTRLILSVAAAPCMTRWWPSCKHRTPLAKPSTSQGTVWAAPWLPCLPASSCRGAASPCANTESRAAADQTSQRAMHANSNSTGVAHQHQHSGWLRLKTFQPSQSSPSVHVAACESACCLLCAYREPKLASSVQGIATFAAPRVGDASFAQRFDAGFQGRCLRFVNGADMVPMLPPKVSTAPRPKEIQTQAPSCMSGGRKTLAWCWHTAQDPALCCSQGSM